MRGGAVPVPGGRGEGAAPGWWALPVDALLVLVFVLVGRRSHDESSAVLGVLTTLWPFLTGTVGGWVLARLLRLRLPSLPAGVVAWVATVLVGMVLRAVVGQGVQTSFVVVATVVVGVALLGWRLVALAVARARRR